MNTQIRRVAIIIGLVLGAFSMSALADWSAPLSSPPTCIAGNPGCDAPIHVGGKQTKVGPLGIGADPGANLFYVNGLGSIKKLITDDLEAWTSFRFAKAPSGGIQAGMVLKSADAYGNVYWAQSSATGGSPIICRKIGTMPGTATVQAQHAITFTASDCGGVLPDSSYVGTFKTGKICWGYTNAEVIDAPPSIEFYGGTYGANGTYTEKCGANRDYEFSAVYIKR